MKKAQDVIAPSAVLCLSLGLFGVSKLMSNVQQRSLPPMAQQLPTTAEATLVDSSEGRLLERLPDSLDPVTVKFVPTNPQDAPPDTIQVALAMHAASAELGDLLQHTRDQQNQWVVRNKSPIVVVNSDVVALMICAFCLAFGLTVAYVDFLEICEEDEEEVKAPSPPSATSLVVKTEGSRSPPSLNCSSVLSTIAVIGVGMALWCSGQPEAAGPAPAPCASTDELEELVRFAKHFFEPHFALVLDRSLLMALPAFVAFGALVSQADKHEMMDQMRDASDHSTAPSTARGRSSREVEPSRQSWHSLLQNVFIVATFLATSMVVMMVRLRMTQNDLAGAVDLVSTKELSDLVLPHIQSSLIPERFLMMAVLACIMFGAVVCQADVSEMTDELRNVPDSDTSKANASALCPQEAVSSRHSWQKLLQCLTIAVMLLVTSSVAMLVWSHVHKDLVLTAESPRIRELSHLLLSSAKPALIPDSFLTMAVAACVAFGAAVSQADVHEMIEDAQDPADRRTSSADDCVSRTQEAEPWCLSWHKREQCLTIAISFLVALRVGILVWHSMHNDMIDATELFPWSKELNDLLLPHLDAALIPDRYLMIALVGFVAFGAAVSQADVIEMTDDQQDAQDRSTSPAEACASCDQEAAPSQHMRHRLLQFHNVAMTLLLTSTVGMLVWSQMCTDGLAAGGFATARELSDLLLPRMRPCLIPDRFLLVALLACASFGAAASQADVHEMTEELRCASDGKTSQAKELQVGTHCAEEDMFRHKKTN